MFVSTPATKASSIRHMPRVLMGVTDLECVGRCSAGRREPDLLGAMDVSNTTPKHGDGAQKLVPTELKRWAARRGATREAEDAPVLVRAAAGSLWSILQCDDIFERERKVKPVVTLCHVLP